MSIKVNVYLNFKGNCKEAFSFYEQVFRTKISYSCTYGEQEEMSSEIKKEEDKAKILHCYLPIAAETSIMGSDVIEGACGDPIIKEGNNVVMTLAPDSEEETIRIFEELSKGGKVLMPLEKTFWNSLYAMFTDKFGINWMVDYSYGEE